MINDIRPTSVDQALNSLKKHLPAMPSRMKQCGQYILVHYDQIAFSTIAEIAGRAGVQPSAMVRFANIMGFGGYSEMQKLFRNEVQKIPPDYATRITNLREKGDLTPSNLLAEFVEAGRFSLEKLIQDIREEDFAEAVKLLADAEFIHIIGFRRAFPIATCLSYTLEKLNIPNFCHDNVGQVEKVNSIRRGDAVLAITFAPYTAGTVEIVKKARDKGADVVALTDSYFSPVNIDGACVLQVVDIDVGDFRSLSASINLAMALAVAVGAYHNK